MGDVGFSALIGVVFLLNTLRFLGARTGEATGRGLGTLEETADSGFLTGDDGLPLEYLEARSRLGGGIVFSFESGEDSQ